MASQSDKLVEGVKKRIGNEPWFKGVCMDGLTDDMTLAEAIDHATSETIYWDSPYLAGPKDVFQTSEEKK
ncbi:Uncharacterised protein [uncultured archaeon]|nr:Uncharacterised protein [uncultured archaeon]